MDGSPGHIKPSPHADVGGGAVAASVAAVHRCHQEVAAGVQHVVRVQDQIVLIAGVVLGQGGGGPERFHSLGSE